MVGMASDLDELNGLIYEHEAIRQHVRSLKNALDKEEELLIQKADKLTAAQSRTLSRSQYHLQQSLFFLRDGLTKHHLYEEKVLPNMIGNLLAAALKSEHKGMIEELSRDATMLHGDVRRLKDKELLARSYNIRQAIDDISRVIEEHITKEDIILGLLKGGLNIQKSGVEPI